MTFNEGQVTCYIRNKSCFLKVYKKLIEHAARCVVVTILLRLCDENLKFDAVLHSKLVYENYEKSDFMN